jgi:hypothetical protein
MLGTVGSYDSMREELMVENLFAKARLINVACSYYLQMCSDLFDDPAAPFNEGTVFARVQASHTKYGDPSTYNVRPLLVQPKHKRRALLGDQCGPP